MDASIIAKGGDLLYTLYISPMPDFPGLKRGEFTNKAVAAQTARAMVEKGEADKAWVESEEGNRTFTVRKHRGKVIARNEAQRLPELISDDDVRKLLEACPNTFIGRRNRMAFVLMFKAGLRVSEVCGLAMRDVDLKDWEITVRHGKGDKGRVVFVGEETMDEIKSWLETRKSKKLKYKTVWFLVTRDGKQCHRQTFNQALAELSKQTGVYVEDGENRKPVHPHVLRHVFATDCIDDDITIPELQELLGHARMDTTQRYLHVRRPALKKKMRDREKRKRMEAEQVG